MKNKVTSLFLVLSMLFSYVLTVNAEETQPNINRTMIFGTSLTLPSQVNVAAEGEAEEIKNVVWDYTALHENQANNKNQGKKYLDYVTGTYEGGTAIAQITVLPLDSKLDDMHAKPQFSELVALNETAYMGKIYVEFDINLTNYSKTNGSTCSFIAFANSNDTTLSWGYSGPQIIIEGDGTLKARNGSGKGKVNGTSNALKKLELNTDYKISVNIDPVSHKYDA